MTKDQLINMIDLVYEDILQANKNIRNRDYFDGVRNAIYLIRTNLESYDET